MIRLAWKNLRFRPLGSWLSILLVAFGTGIISLLFLLERQLDQKFSRDMEGIDLVVGAKGSALQLVLSAVYHLDAPPGNIPADRIERLMRHPMIKTAIPLAYGDTYEGARILGTTQEYLTKYGAEFRAGETFNEPLEAVLGARVAATTGLKPGGTFIGAHGVVVDSSHANNPYRVVGILEPAGNVLDDLVLTDVSSVWKIHEDHDHSDLEDAHGHENHSDHDHDEGEHDHGEAAHDHDAEREYTAVLLEFSGSRGVVTLQPLINGTPDMLAASPSYEMSRLFSNLGVGLDTLRLVAYGIVFLSAFSIFFALYSRLRERRHELALLRALGYRPVQLFGLLLTEGVLLTAIGALLGLLLSRLAIHLLNAGAAADFKLRFDYGLIPAEGWLLLGMLTVGLVSALLPALRAMRTDVARELSR